MRRTLFKYHQIFVAFVRTVLVSRLQEPKEKIFCYTYLRYPFDDAQHFSVTAASQEQADGLATVKFAAMLKARTTVMTTFYRARPEVV